MARRKQRRNKIEPSVMTLTFATPVIEPGAPVSQYIDISQVASLVNRRFYRQGINWAVAGIKILNLSGYAGSVRVSKLPNTWTMSNAWEKGFRAWQKMNNEALEDSESVRPRFLDFKVYADAEHHAAGYALNLLPVSHSGTAIAGEWEPSKFEIPTGTAGTQGATASREVVATGSNYPGLGASGLDAISLIEGYAASRGLPNVLDPNTPDDAADTDGFNPDNWIAATFNEGTNQTEDVLEDMITENNIAPYPFENDGVHLDTMYPGGANQLVGLEIHSSEFITPTTIGGTTRIKGGNFPCGLMRFEFENAGSSVACLIEISLVPGNHRGYFCESMTEM